jgi:hypothetical protein
MKANLVLLTFNEIDGCRKDFPKLPKEKFNRIVAIDGNSTDGTVEFLIENDVEIIKQNMPSYNGALSELLHFNDDNPVIVFHPKGTVDPQVLLEISKALSDGYDLVIASRNMKSAQNEEDFKVLRFRKWFGVLVGLYLYKLFSREKPYLVSDPLHGIRGLSGNFLKQLRFRPLKITGDLEMVVSAYSSHSKIIEIPSIEFPRIAGATHFPAIKSGLRIMIYLIEIFVSSFVPKVDSKDL